MLLTSPSFENDAPVPTKFTCDGGDINPEFQIQNVPGGAKSLALVMHDPDAPLAGGFTHWIVWNINPKTTLIKEESVPPGAVEGLNGARAARYAGPCPPRGHGIHHYHFRLYALDVLLDLPVTAELRDLGVAMTGHILGDTELIGTYERS